MRIAWCCFSMFLATASALANRWLANEADIVAQVKAALPIGLQVTHTGYGDFLFEGISHFYIHIVDDSEPTPKVRANRAFDAQVVLLPFDFDYAGMRNSEELDRFLIAHTTTYKALFLVHKQAQERSDRLFGPRSD